MIAVAVAATVVLPAPAQAARFYKPLVAGSTTETGQSFGTSLRLPLRTDDFQLIKRPSRASITLGYPKTERVTRHGRRVTVNAKPCAIVTYRLSIAPGSSDPLTVVRSAVPDAGIEGTERFVKIGETVDTTGPVRRAWRIASSIDKAGLLSSHGQSVEQLRPQDPFGPPVDALRTITFSARMLRIGEACGGANSYTLGPGATSPIQLG
jgi:hypothetical protein